MPKSSVNEPGIASEVAVQSQAERISTPESKPTANVEMNRQGWTQWVVLNQLAYDARRDLILLVAGAGGDTGKASVYALRFKDR